MDEGGPRGGRGEGKRREGKGRKAAAGACPRESRVRLPALVALRPREPGVPPANRVCRRRGGRRTEGGGGGKCIPRVAARPLPARARRARASLRPIRAAVPRDPPATRTYTQPHTLCPSGAGGLRAGGCRGAALVPPSRCPPCGEPCSLLPPGPGRSRGIESARAGGSRK